MLDGNRVYGVVTVDAVLEAVRPIFDAVTVDDGYSSKLVSAAPEATSEQPSPRSERRVSHSSLSSTRVTR